jgi:hypothetical protein
MVRPRAGQRVRGGIVALLAIVALALAAPAAAQEPPPSAADQYAELVPSADGPKAPGAEETRTPLPPAGSDALEQAPPAIAAPLEEVATSSRYGAPSSPRPPVAQDRERADVPASVSVQAALRGTIKAASSTDDRQLVGTGVALLLVTAGAVMLALRRTRTTD